MSMHRSGPNSTKRALHPISQGPCRSGGCIQIKIIWRGSKKGTLRNFPQRQGQGVEELPRVVQDPGVVPQSCFQSWPNTQGIRRPASLLLLLSPRGRSAGWRMNVERHRSPAQRQCYRPAETLQRHLSAPASRVVCTPPPPPPCRCGFPRSTQVLPHALLGKHPKSFLLELIYICGNQLLSFLHLPFPETEPDRRNPGAVSPSLTWHTQVESLQCARSQA